jgi:hypothetical protein
MKQKQAKGKGAGKGAVTSGSRPMQRAGRSPAPQTKPALTPKQTIHQIYLQTRVAQIDVVKVFRSLFEIASKQLKSAGMFTVPELGYRVWREPIPQTGRAAGFPADAEAREKFALRGVPLKRLLVSTGAVRSD